MRIVLQPNKEPVKCFPVQPIKNQVTQKNLNVKFNAPDIHKDTWNRYPCKRYENCRTDHCNGKVSFFVTNNDNLSILRLLFVREDKSAFVHINQQLRKLFDDGFLSPVDPVTVYVKPPIEIEPTERAVSWYR